MSLQMPSQPPKLPLELWEHIFLQLVPVEIIGLRAVNRSFRDTIDRSPEAQYLIDLYAAGLEVEHRDPSLSLADRRKQLDRYRSHWDSLQWVEHSSIPVPHCPGGTVNTEGGIVYYVLGPYRVPPTVDYHFVQLPSVLRGIPLKQWTLHGLPNHRSPGLFPEEDLLVICSPVDNDRSFEVLLLRMSDGQPHPDASIPVINGPDYEHEDSLQEIVRVKATSSRLAVTTLVFPGASNRNFMTPWHFHVWDWKSGVKYVEIWRRSTDVQFIDEYRMFGVTGASGADQPRLVTLLDTSAPVENPHEPREIVFELDDGEKPVSSMDGTYSRGAKLGSSFQTNRRRHVLGIECSSANQGSPWFVINYESICAIASANKSSSHIPWDSWKQKTTQGSGSPLLVTLAGPRVFVEGGAGPDASWIESFDFTPGACRSIEQPDPSSEAAPAHAVRCVTLTNVDRSWRGGGWFVSEDNFLVSEGNEHDPPKVLEMWTF